jgi:DNA-binding CsgD family transcriptional regulator
MLSLAVILPTLLIIPFMNSILLTIAMPVLFVLLIVLHGAASNCYSLSSASGGIQSSSQKNDGGFIGLSFGLLIGYLSQSWASGSPVFFVLLYYIFLLGVVLIVNSCFKSLKQQSTQLTSELAKMDDIMHLKARRAAQRYKLSTRQFEILDLLVHGRNAAHIAEKLYISKNTARSHIYTLFKTFGVHSQQDLIDLIETSRPPMQRNKSNHQV